MRDRKSVDQLVPFHRKLGIYPNLCLLSSPQEYPCGIRTRVTKRLSLSFCSEALAPASAFSLAALDRPQLFLCRLWHQPQLFLWRLWHIGLSFFLAGCTFCDKESRFVSNLSPVARVSSNLCCFSPFRTSFFYLTRTHICAVLVRSGLVFLFNTHTQS